MSSDAFQRLIRVVLSHDYYGQGAALPFLGIEPLPAARALMANLGLVFRPEPDGFSVHYRPKRREALFRALRRAAEIFTPADYDSRWDDADDWRTASPSRLDALFAHWRQSLAPAGWSHLGDLADMPGQLVKPQYWLRLGFLMHLGDSRFANVTALPLWADPGRRGFFFSNLQAAPSGSRRAPLMPAAGVGKSLASLRGGSFPWRLPEGSGLLLRDFSGRVLRDYPRQVPTSLPGIGDPNAIDGRQLRDWLARAPAPPADWLERRFVTVDLQGRPDGLYLCEALDTDRRPRPILTCSGKPPLMMVELLLCDPTGCGRGRFPVGGLSTPHPMVRPVDYELAFSARRTFWTYYIVPGAAGVPVQPSRIECRNDPAIRFSGPRRVTLPTGAKAFAFVSEQPLPLRRQSEFRFRLLGRRRGQTAEESVLMDCLPVASNLQVRPAAPAAASSAGGHSDIYVHL